MIPNKEWLVTHFPCADYFAARLDEMGFYDEDSYNNLIYDIHEIELSEDEQFLVIGRAGCDGITFGYRTNQNGIWAYYPIDNDYKLMSDTVTNFIQSWLNGTLYV